MSLLPLRLPGLANCMKYAWAAPTTAVGLLFLLLAPMGGRIGTQVVDGVLELHGGLVSLFLRRGTLLKNGASAMTLGHVVLGLDPEALEWSRDHERVHVRQCERWGPLFIPAYVLASAIIWVRGGRFYEENPFEREAYGRIEPSDHYY